MLLGLHPLKVMKTNQYGYLKTERTNQKFFIFDYLMKVLQENKRPVNEKPQSRIPTLSYNLLTGCIFPF